MRPPKAEAVCPLICEDIRLEASDRLSLMGVFGPAIDVESIPAMMPGLCAVLIVRNPEEILSEITISLLGPGGEQIVPPSTNQIAKTDAAKFAHQFQVKILPFPIAGEGEVKFRFTFNGGDEIGVEVPVNFRLKAAK